MNSNAQSDALRSRWTLQGRVPLSGVADGAEWHRARSISTGEDVVLFVVRGEAALEAADAVRRAYLVEDPHLLAVKDIVVLDDPREGAGDAAAAEGTEGPTTVVEYALPPAPPLAAMLADGPLHPETARAIIGEAATGLEVARRRGVRHQLLDSNRVFVDTRSGDVVILGVGVEAASHPGLDRSREVASFQDTVTLVAMLYRALTGRSPRRDDSGTVPQPSTLIDTAIPEDLDLLCDLVLNETSDDIPETTRGLIEELQPWQSIPVTLQAYTRSSGQGAAAEEGGPEESDDAELESTAQMGAVPDEADETGETGETEESDETERSDEADEDTDGRPSSQATAAGVAAGAGVAGAAALTASSVGPSEERSDRPESQDAAPQESASPQESADPQEPTDPEESTDAEESTTAPESTAPQDEAATDDQGAQRLEQEQRTSKEAQALVEDLHLDQKRDTSEFPGHLEITRPSEPEPDAEQEPPPGTTGSAVAGAGAVAAGAGAVAAGAGAVSSADIPSRTSGTHWPAGRPAERTAPLAPSTASSPEPVPAGSTAATPDQSAPTPTHPPTWSAEPAPTAPVPVAGRSTPIAHRPEDGPIVVHGRDRSYLEDRPQESTASSSRSSLLRDVVGVAVGDDAPGTYALGPTDREKRSLQSQWIVIGGAIAVMIALVIALTTITSDIRDILQDPLATSPAVTTAAPTEEETDEAPSEPTAEATEEELPAPEIEGLEMLALPQGQEPDHTDQQERLTDGDPSTYWSTQYYASPDFGGLKEGVGMRLQFAEPSTFTALTLTTTHNNGGTVELRSVNEDGSPGDVLATGEFVADGEVRLEAPEQMETEQVMVWISDLPPDSEEDGRFRARIAEIQAE